MITKIGHRGAMGYAPENTLKSFKKAIELNVDQNFVDDAHKRDLKVYVWTVNDPEDIKKMKDLGVDGIFSDFPDRI
jgi:glycerophosphoryl diester phosphodiesterase